MIAPVLKSLFRKDPARSQAERLYAALAGQARAPEFHLTGGVADTPEGRFELLGVHMALIMRRLRREAPGSDLLLKYVQEVFFERLDAALREMGVGDLAVGRKIRTLAESFYGRYRAYESALERDGGALDEALARNVYADTDPVRAVRLSAYMRAAAAILDETPAGELANAMSRLREISKHEFSGAER